MVWQTINHPMSRTSSLLFLFPPNGPSDHILAAQLLLFLPFVRQIAGRATAESVPGGLTPDRFLITPLPPPSGFLTIDQLSRPRLSPTHTPGVICCLAPVLQPIKVLERTGRWRGGAANPRQKQPEAD